MYLGYKQIDPINMARLRVCDESALKLLEYLQNDLKNLSIETKKRFPHIKEACEESILKLRNAVSTPQTPIYHITNQILYPVVQGCETKDLKIVKLCLSMIQKLISYQAVDHKGARFITDTLWMLMESGIEEVKLLQSSTLLLTTNTIVHGDTLAKNLVLCFRLHFTKDSTTVNTAGATVRQLVSLVFERVVAEDKQYETANNSGRHNSVDLEQLKLPSNMPPKGLRPCAADAYLLFQDLVQLVNADQPYWLNGLTEMTRTFGLELLESLLVNFSTIFFNHPEFKFLLKERVCALIIKLFSPNIKFRNYGQVLNNNQSTLLDKPYFPISIRLLRVVTTLVQKYHHILVTECEIFLSLIVKFLESDKPAWQRSVALEVLHKLSIQPELLVSFCECYDLKTHSTNIFKDIVTSLGNYVQSLFNCTPYIPPMLPGSYTQMHPNHPVTVPPSSGPGMTSQPGFYSRGIWIPVIVSFPPGTAKCTYLEMMDKVEPPAIPDGYGMSVAYASFMDLIRSLSSIMEKQNEQSLGADSVPEKECEENSEQVKKLYRQLINSSWGGILSALSPMVESSTDESVTENLLKIMQTYVNLAGKLGLSKPRDAFIIAICQAALPPNYVITVNGEYIDTSQEGNNNVHYTITGYSGNEVEYKQQVVAVGSPLPSAVSQNGMQQGPVMLTAKNLQCMRGLLYLAHCHGTILGTSWLIVLTTIQHLVWVLGLKPTTGGSLKAGRTTSDTNAVITTAVMADLPVLSTMLSRLFESSQFLDDAALHNLIDALCKLSHEAMDLAFCNREPSLFAVAKLLETGLVNLSRVNVVWNMLTNHLLQVCQHPHIRMREWGVEAITYLVKVALQYKYELPLMDNQDLQILLLSPLVRLSTIRHGDVRQRQLECVLNILHSSGELLTYGWPFILNIVGAVSDQHGENLIRIAFQCLQLLVTDFLPLMPWQCLPLCLETTAKFGSQLQELNISLTAIGLMWNIADYFYQNKEKLCEDLETDKTAFCEHVENTDMPAFDKLWMCLFIRLSKLCTDTRPAVRKSAGQTLFSTISAHGSLLAPVTWHAVLWQVLFPLLSKVRNLSNSASNKKVDAGGSILIHHSRNTAQKQWAETQVLTLSGVVRVFNAKRQLLATMTDFPKVWSLLLEFIENSALSVNNEVSLAALRSFQEMLFVHDSILNGNEDCSTVVSVVNNDKNENKKDIWDVAWDVWMCIAVQSLNKTNAELDAHFPPQSFLSSLIHIFPAIFEHMQSKFVTNELDRLCRVLESAAAAPIFTDTTPFYLPTSETSLSQLQEGIINCLELLENHALYRKAEMGKFICILFRQLLSFSRYAHEYPHYTTKQMEQKFILLQKDILVVNYVPFGEKTVTMAVNLYKQMAEEDEVIKQHVLKSIIEALHPPLSKRNGRSSYSTWKLIVASFMTVLSHGIPLARKYPSDFKSMWPVLATSLDHLLFPKLEKSTDHFVEDEAIDCQIIDFLKDEVLSHSSSVPKDFILKVVVLLNKGSILSPCHNSLIRRGSEMNLREEFAKICFETLLQFSLLDGLNVGEDLAENIKEGDEVTGRLAVTALLFRFQEVLKKYILDENRCGKCPLPRHRLSEISFVLKAIATLIVSLKKTPEKVSTSVWEQVIKLYPHLVNCSVTTSSQISASLREALHQYCELLAPPAASMNTPSTP